MTFAQYLASFNMPNDLDDTKEVRFQDSEQIIDQYTRFGNKLADHLGLTFMIMPEDGNVCFADQQVEMRDEFKTTITPINLWDYLNAVAGAELYRGGLSTSDFSNVPFPADAARFWQLVRIGSNRRNDH